MEIENNPSFPKKKLEMFEILKEAILVPCKNINFIFFEVITSFTLFCILVNYEILLQTTVFEISDILRQPPGYLNYSWPIPLHITKKLNWEFSYKLIQLTLIYLLPLHLLEFFSILLTVEAASKIYANWKSLTLKEMIREPIQETRLTGAFITSVYVLVLSTCTLLGLIWLVTNYYVVLRNFVFDVFFALYGSAFVVLLTKYLEWTAMWNMSMVISILEGVYGHEALALSAYFIRGSERRGLLLMLVFFVWGNGLRLPCLYGRCFEGGYGIVAQVGLLCVCHVIKWIACMVCFYDFKERVLEKKVDEERGEKYEALDK
ncbi:hypothetical protein PTKIN_Ptkin17bG0079000 [Pterospermum kingtungense]